MNCKCGKLVHSKGLCSTCCSREWRKNNPDKYRSGQNKWYKNNKDRAIEYAKAYTKRNPHIAQKCKENFKPKLNNYYKNRYRTDLQFRLKVILRNRLIQSIKKDQRAGSAVRDLGCSIEELKQHLESKFHIGMTWDNMGDWEIDHIKPLSSFDLTDREQFLRACHYTNLQPLWKEDNLSKGSVV